MTKICAWLLLILLNVSLLTPVKADPGLNFAQPTHIPTTPTPISPAPVEFVTQILEPTGGKVQRPKDWFYSEHHRGPVYDWVISKEDASGHHSYLTGYRIECFNGVKAGTGKTAQEFIQSFIDSKKKDSSVNILSSCQPKDQGMFTRTCLETEEGQFHIQYSLFWGSNGLDIAVITIAGAPKEIWTNYTDTFNKMNSFELIDMKRFTK